MSLVPFTIDPFFGEDLFFQPFRPSSMAKTGASARGVATDVVEEADKFVIKADIPGVKKEDIHITTEGDVLSLSVESTTEKEEEDPNKKYHRIERSSMFASRSIRLPKNADLDDVKATYTDGVLCLDVPKKEEKPQTKRITVK